MSARQGFRDLYLEELRDLYNAEQQLIKALPQFASAASSPELKHTIEDHLEETRGHVKRLDRIFNNLQEKPKGENCDAMEGLLKEGRKLLGQGYLPEVCDAALIAVAQRIEHYEMAGYGAARSFARMLDDEESASILQETLDEEGAANKMLTNIAESSVNREAVHAG